MGVLNEHVERLKPRTFRALQLKRAWQTWYTKLNWYDQNIGSTDVMRDAFDRIDAYEHIGSDFGEERELIKLGSSGPLVAEWQKFLGITPNGVFDQQTYEATKNYQRGKGLKPDGKVGRNTWGTVPQKITLSGLLSRFRTPLTIGAALTAGGVLAVVTGQK